MSYQPLSLFFCHQGIADGQNIGSKYQPSDAASLDAGFARLAAKGIEWGGIPQLMCSDEQADSLA